jgi:chromosome segregation ATPase
MSRLEGEQARLMEARVRAIESTNAHLDKTQELSAAERRGRIDALERELTRLRHRVEHAQTEKRGLQATLIELQAKIALELESARGEDRAAKLASAEWDNLRRKWGEDVSADRVRSLDGEVAAVQAELAQVAAQRESVRARLADAERACESAEAELADSHRRHATSEVEAQADVDALFRMALSSLLRVEGQQRDVVALQCATATDELAIEERASWDTALRATEGLVHEAGHSHTRREITAGTSRVSVIHDRIITSKTRFEIFETRIAKSQAQHNAIVAEYHEQHRQLLEEEKAEELNHGDDSRTPEEAMLALELEHATRDSQRKARAIRNALARAPVDPLASARPVVLPSLADIYKRLQRLLRDARRRAQDADAETSNTDRTLRRVSREIDERSEIRSRVRSAITRYEARIEELEAHLTRASMALDSRAHRDNALREQLKLEYHEAQELLSRHRREDEQRLRESYEAIDELRGQVQQSTAQVQSLRQELAMAKRRNTPANEDICRAELRFESERARELDALLAEAMARTQGAAARRTPLVDAAFESAAAHSLRSSRAPSSIDHSSASASVIAEELGSD